MVSPSTIDKMFEIYTFFENTTEIYTFFENRIEIYTCILFENRTKISSILSMVWTHYNSNSFFRLTEPNSEANSAFFV